MDKDFNWWFTTFLWCIPLLIIIYSYVERKVVRALAKRQAEALSRQVDETIKVFTQIMREGRWTEFTQRQRLTSKVIWREERPGLWFGKKIPIKYPPERPIREAWPGILLKTE